MKRVLLSKKAVNIISSLRDQIGTFEYEKLKIANALSSLSDFIQFLRDSPDESAFVDKLLYAMDIIASYNRTIDALAASSDRKLPEYCLVEKDGHDAFETGEYMPNDGDVLPIGIVIEKHGVKIPDGLDVKDMTIRELAESVGYSVEYFNGLVSEQRGKMNKKLTDEQLRKLAKCVAEEFANSKDLQEWVKESMTVEQATEWLGMSVEKLSEIMCKYND